MRVMIRMFTATYTESVSCTPTWLLSEPSGPIENGTTYIVRPRIEPANSSLKASRISPGSRQLLVGPASSSVAMQMNVRSSTRATSPGIREGQVGTRPLCVGEALEGPRLDELGAQALVLLGGAVAPDHVLGFGERRHLLHPRQQTLVLGRGGKRGAHRSWRLLWFACKRALQR